MASNPPMPEDANGYWLPLSVGLVTSEAWRSLPSLSHSIYAALAGEYRIHNNGNLGLSQRQAMERTLCKTPRLIVEAFRALEVTGVLVRTYMGHRGIQRYAYTQAELDAERAPGAAKQANAIKPKGIASKWQMTDVTTRDLYGSIIPATLLYRQWEPGKDMRLVVNERGVVPDPANPIKEPTPGAFYPEANPTGLSTLGPGPAQYVNVSEELTDDDIPF